jgi:hypothetical protein
MRVSPRWELTQIAKQSLSTQLYATYVPIPEITGAARQTRGVVGGLAVLITGSISK